LKIFSCLSLFVLLFTFEKNRRMDPSEFANSPIKERIYLIFEHGNEIAARQFLYFNIKLYTLFGFFAEVWYIPNSNKIDKVEVLSTDEILSLYKNEFDISELLN
jgi:hypothetical protein